MVVLPEDGTALYAGIYKQFRQQIQDGTLKAGDKLPSKRVLASQLGVSLNTVDGAYGQLQSEGYVESRPKSGYYVCYIETMLPMSTTPMTVAPSMGEPSIAVVDFSPRGIAAEKFPFTVWQRMLKQALADGDALSRSPRQGDWQLRQEIATYLHRARGVNATADQVVIGAGTDRLLAMVSYILPSDWQLAIENPVYTKAYRQFARMGHPVVPAEIDYDGVMVEPLESLERAVVFTTPSHQYPLGLSMPMGRRVKLLNWAGTKPERYIIEDDYDSEFRYDSKPVPSLQSIDHHHKVIYLGTFSRSIAPSIRVSYMVLPPWILERYQQEYGEFSSDVSALEQRALAYFMAGGHFETHLNRMRVHYRNKRQWMLDAMEGLSNMAVIGEAAGHHLTLKSKVGMTEVALCQKAKEAGVMVYPISPYFLGDCPYEGKVLLGFGGLSKEEIQKGMELLTKAWQ
ncbi:MAG: PLP-dependent aminotransferase family protein [Eubacteriales bacterium]